MMRGIYRWQVLDFKGGYLKFNTNVEILGETEKMYTVKYLNGGPYGARPGHVTRVRKKSVLLEDAPIIHRAATCARLPYKD